jgi:hypothetical protein
MAGAITFDGNTSGVFMNPTGGSSMVTSIQTVGDTSRFTWGTGVSSPPSSLYFDGASFSGVTPGQFFNLGSLTYFNGSVASGTEADSVVLRNSLSFTNPSGIILQSFNFGFQLINRPNTDDPTASADSVFLSTNFQPTIFSFGGINYTLDLTFGTVSGINGFSNPNEFFVREGQSAGVSLLGKITAQTPPPSVPDAGSTLALMGMAVVGLGGLKKYVARKA